MPVASSTSAKDNAKGFNGHIKSQPNGAKHVNGKAHGSFLSDRARVNEIDGSKCVYSSQGGGADIAVRGLMVHEQPGIISFVRTTMICDIQTDWYQL